MGEVCAHRGGGYRDAPGRQSAAQDEEKSPWAEDTEDQPGAAELGRAWLWRGGRGQGRGVAKGVAAWRTTRGRRAPARRRIFSFAKSCLCPENRDS